MPLRWITDPRSGKPVGRSLSTYNHPQGVSMNHSNRTRQFVESVADWARPIPWQLFVHLTFPWNVRSEAADSKFRAFVNDLEKHLKTRVCFIAGKEGRSK